MADLKRSAEKMRMLFIAIGLIFLLGGAAALKNPKRVLVPSFSGRYGGMGAEDVSKERGMVYGYVSIAIGASALAIAALVKKAPNQPPVPTRGNGT